LAPDFAFDRYASSSTWVGALDELVFAAIGLAVLARGGRGARSGAVIGLGLLALFTAATKAAVLLHGVVLAALPANATRTLVVIALGFGAAASAAGALLVVSPEFRETLTARPGKRAAS
jgi:hypothetical protein